jgi:hypothetical protein
MRAVLLLGLLLCVAAQPAAADGRLQRFIHQVKSQGVGQGRPLSRSKAAGAKSAFLSGNGLQVVVRNPRFLREAIAFHNTVYQWRPSSASARRVTMR